MEGLRFLLWIEREVVVWIGMLEMEEGIERNINVLVG